MTKDKTLEAIIAGAKANGSWDKKYPDDDKKAQPAQEPVAWGVFEGNLHDIFFTQAEAQEMAELKGSHAKVQPLYTTPQPEAQTACCAECGRKESDGWFLYCVDCMEKTNV